jgi:hypothetical protein
MPPKMTYEKVKEILHDTDIILLTTNEEFKIVYKNYKSELNCLYNCGHERTSCWNNIKKRISKGKNLDLCPDCSKSVQIKNLHKSRDEKYQERNNFETNERKCTKCKLWLHIDDYNMKKSMRDGISSICSKCVGLYVKNHKAGWFGDKFIIRHSIKTSLENHQKREEKGRTFEHQHNYKLEDVNNHKNENGKFICVFSGEELFPRVMDDKSKQMSLDRKDSEKTYWKDKSGDTDEDNVQITSSTINNMKSDLSDEEFLSIIEKIAIYRLGMVHPTTLNNL